MIYCVEVNCIVLKTHTTPQQTVAIIQSNSLLSWRNEAELQRSRNQFLASYLTPHTNKGTPFTLSF